MYILVLPVSGGGFVSQLAILQHLCEVQFVPDLTLASSGGNVAAYVAAAANWKWAGIERIASELTQELFAKPWNNISSLSLIIGYFKGDVYNKGSGVHNFISRHFSPTSITKYEIWTGTYNKGRQKARLFCNRSKDNSIMDVTCIDHDLTQSMEPIFTDGNIELISEAGVASASIPAMVPAQKIFNEDYIDGGIAGASPLTIMQEPILKYTRERDEPLHLVYINSVDLSRTDKTQIRNVFDNWRQAGHDLVRSQTVIDRLSGYDLLRCHLGSMNKAEFICTYDNMQRIRQIQSKVKYSMLEIFPLDRYDIDLVKFNGYDVITAIREAYKNCKCRLWWLTPSEDLCYQDICVILDECKNCKITDEKSI
jgi:predicted acylesterase/phospholipase RssA